MTPLVVEAGLWKKVVNTQLKLILTRGSDDKRSGKLVGQCVARLKWSVFAMYMILGHAVGSNLRACRIADRRDESHECQLEKREEARENTMNKRKEQK